MLQEDSEPHRWEMFVDVRQPVTYIKIYQPDDEDSFPRINSYSPAPENELSSTFQGPDPEHEPLAEHKQRGQSEDPFFIANDGEAISLGEGMGSSNDALGAPLTTFDDRKAGSSRIPGGHLSVDTIPLSAVSVRKTKRIRNSDVEIHYFESVGTSPIDAPPDLTKDGHGVQLYDLYVHKSHEGRQAWRCHPLGSVSVWTPLEEMKEYAIGQSGLKRTFVFTETGLPSFVQVDTIGRLYKHKTQDSTSASISSASVPDSNKLDVDKKGKKRAN